MPTRKKTTFKQRLRKNNMKQRTNFTTTIRKRMGGSKRNSNRADRIHDESRPLSSLVSDIAEGGAVVPTDDFSMDARGLTDLLLRSRPAAEEAEGDAAATPIKPKEKQAKTATGTSSSSSSSSSAKTPKSSYALSMELPEELRAVDAERLERERLRREAEQAAIANSTAAMNQNKNHYRHHGQPYLFWTRVGLHPRLLSALRRMRFSHPTPVQEEVLPAVLNPELAAEIAAAKKAKEAEAHEEEENAENEEDNGTGKKRKKGKKSAAGHGVSAEAVRAAHAAKDVVVSAETGSGKTLVFALPVLNRILQSLEADDMLLTEEELDKFLKADEAALQVAAQIAKAKKSGRPLKRSRSADSASSKKTKRDGAKRKKVEESGAGEDAEKDEGDANGRGEETQEIAATGSLIPLKRPAVHLDRSDFEKRLMHTLIISPTRELALQINQCFKDLTHFCPEITVGCVVGGMAAEKQQRVLNRHPHVLICTPGRLWELVQQNEGCYLGHSISRRLNYVVLDEADKMLQSGRFEELKSLLDRIHCDVLPAGFGQQREEGAETEPAEMETGRWDAEKQKFVPLTKEEKQQLEERKKKQVQRKNKRFRSDSEEDTRQRKVSKKKRHNDEEDGEEQEEDVEEEEEEEEMEEEEEADASHPKSRKDQPQPIPMPAEPAEGHRVTTYVTSATLSLQTNYERRDYKSNKSIIRTSNADVMNKVLQQLEIKPSEASVFTLSTQASVAAKINETYLRCPDNSKDLYMYYFLKTYQDERTIIFVNAISMLRRLVKLLDVLGIAVVGLHASMQQRQRLKFIDKFRRGEIRVLVATDVASRGLDVDGLKYVLHYQVPRSTDAYIHRCGRTARCGGTGLSLLMLSAQEHMSFRKLMESLGRKESEIETFAVQTTVVHQLHQHLRIARQIDKLQKEIDKSSAQTRWVKRMNAEAELDTDDMIDPELDNENRGKAKAIRVLRKELQLLTSKYTGSFGGKGAFRTGAIAVGAMEAERKLKERAERQALLTKPQRK